MDENLGIFVHVGNNKKTRLVDWLEYTYINIKELNNTDTLSFRVLLGLVLKLY